MTRLFGCICNQPERLILALEPVRQTLVAKAPVSRWGLGYVQSDEVLLTRTPRRSDEDVDFFEALQRIRSDYVIAHASADDGFYGTENTQPFRSRRWLFAQEGTLSDVVRLEPLLLEHIPEFLRQNLKGKTLAELVFYTFLAALHERNALEDTNLPVAEARRTLASAVDRVAGAMKEAGITGPLGNLMVCNNRTLMAVRLDLPMYMRRLVIPGPGYPSARANTTFKGILVVSADSHPGEGFEEIPARSTLLLSREVRPDVVLLHA